VEDEEDEQTKTEPTHHVWASERSVGEFQRTFSFLACVDQDNVLSVQVPKATATKKITIE
jgi:HSP20 family molecular chaperone IbpA